MPVAVLLTCVAFGGVVGGVLLHRGLSNLLAAAGGVLLLTIAFVWIVPEIAEPWSWPRAVAFVLMVAAILAVVDFALIRLGHSPRHGVVAPLLAATAIHSLLDGWGIRTLAGHPSVPGTLVPVGLAMHKLPEGFALGFVLRRSLGSHKRAITLGFAAEAFTLLGALLQPLTRRSGEAMFGPSWTPTVLCVIGGAFVFLGCHALLPYFTGRQSS